MVHRKARPLPPRAVDALSATLFAAPGPLVTGAAILCVATFLVAHRTQGAVPFWGAVALAAIGCARVGLLVAYLASPARLRKGTAMALWRRLYAVGLLACSLVLGLVTLGCLHLYDDPVSNMILVATSVGYGSGVAGRNAACLEVSLPQLWAALMPTAAGLALHGGADHAILAGVVATFAVGMTQIGFSINASLLSAYHSAHEREVLADRFDAALASMQHGFCLFDRDGRLSACSEIFGTLFRMPTPPVGTDVDGIVDAWI